MCIKLHQCTTAKWHLQWAGPSCSVAPVVDKQLYPESVIIPRIRPQILCRVMPLNYRKNQVGSECAAKLSLCMSIILPPGNSPCRLQGQGFPPPHTRLPSELTSWECQTRTARDPPPWVFLFSSLFPSEHILCPLSRRKTRQLVNLTKGRLRQRGKIMSTGNILRSPKQGTYLLFAFLETFKTICEC